MDQSNQGSIVFYEVQIIAFIEFLIIYLHVKDFVVRHGYNSYAFISFQNLGYIKKFIIVIVSIIRFCSGGLRKLFEKIVAKIIT